MHRRALTGLLPVLLVAAAAAQTSPVVTEAEFLSALDDSHPAVAEKSEAVAVARARVVATATLENPTFGVIREDPKGPAGQTDWTLSWQLPESRRRLAIEAREEATRAAEARLARDLLSLRLAMREVYAEWAVAAARRQRHSAQAARVEALAARETTRSERGETSGLEARRLVLAAAGLRARFALAAAAADQARASAESWYPGLSANAEPVLPPLPPAPKLEEDHPRLRAARADLGVATLELQAAGRFVRSPELVVGWQEAGPESRDGPILGFAWSVPLFARNQAEQALAEARVSAARAHLERVRREVDSARTAARSAYRRLAAAVADAEVAMAGNDEMIAGAEAAFRYGEVSLTDLLDSLRSAAEAEMTRLDLHQAALVAHRELEGLAGSRLSGPHSDSDSFPSDPPAHPTPKEFTP